MREVQIAPDIAASNIGFGTYHLRDKLHPLDAVDCMGGAFEAGVTLFDTSDNYGAEDLIGRALDEGVLPRDEVVIATKTGLALTAYEAQEFSRRRKSCDISPERIRRQVDKSLKLLGAKIEAIDLYQLHVRDEDVPHEEQAGVMAELIDEGKIRHYGVSNYDAEELRALLTACDTNGLPRPVSIQPHMNIIDPPGEEVSVAAEEGLVVLGYSPLNKGFLTDAMVATAQKIAQNQLDSEQPIGDGHREWEILLQGTEPLADLVRMAEGYGLTLAQLAIGWVATQPNTVALTACTSKEYLQDALIAANVDLRGKQDEIEDIQHRLEQIQFAGLARSLMRQVKMYYR